MEWQVCLYGEQSSSNLQWFCHPSFQSVFVYFPVIFNTLAVLLIYLSLIFWTSENHLFNITCTSLNASIRHLVYSIIPNIRSRIGTHCDPVWCFCLPVVYPPFLSHIGYLSSWHLFAYSSRYSLYLSRSSISLFLERHLRREARVIADEQNAVYEEIRRKLHGEEEGVKSTRIDDRYIGSDGCWSVIIWHWTGDWEYGETLHSLSSLYILLYQKVETTCETVEYCFLWPYSLLNAIVFSHCLIIIFFQFPTLLCS